MTADTGNDMPDWYRAAVSPRSIAIIGASSRPAKNHFQQQLRIYEYAGNLYPINPRESEIEGLPAFASIKDVPEEVDLALIALPAVAVPGAVAECVEAGVGVVYAFTAGFSESGADGAVLEKQIAETLAASNGRTRMLGPNGTGVISAPASMVAVPLAARNSRLGPFVDGGLAIASQSGLVSSAAFIASQLQHPGIGKAIAIGNEIDLGLADVIEGFVRDPDVSVILTYLEGLREPARFLEAAREARRCGKPVVTLKGGTTDAGAAAAASHTAALAVGDAVFSGVLAQAGVRRVTSVGHMLDVARVLQAYPGISGRRVTIMTSSGGLGIMLTDLLVDAGFELGGWGKEERLTLRSVLPPFVSVSNPLDGAGDFAWGRSQLEAAIRCADTNEKTDLIIVALGGMPDCEQRVAQLLPEYRELTSKPVLAAWVGGTGRAIDTLNAAGVPAFDDLERLTRALTAAVSEVGPDVLGAGSDAAPVTPDPAVREQVLAAVRTAESAGRTSLDEVASKSVLKTVGISVAEEVAVPDCAAAVAAASAVGYPVVMKLRAPGLMHKSELGAVALNIRNEATIRREADRLLRIAADQGIESADLIVQRQIPEGVELLLGMTRDAVFGPVITVGLGGVLTEALGDVQIFAPDIDRPGFLRAFRSLQHQRLLTGYRHLPAVDIEKLWSAVRRFAVLVQSVPDEVREIDVNPMIAEIGGSVTAVDALFVLGTVGDAEI
ncbi:acetate--CoA ligase family protein [Nocardia rhamnosiphila]